MVGSAFHSRKLREDCNVPFKVCDMLKIVLGANFYDFVHQFIPRINIFNVTFFMTMNAYR